VEEGEKNLCLLTHLGNYNLLPKPVIIALIRNQQRQLLKNRMRKIISG